MSLYVPAPINPNVSIVQPCATVSKPPESDEDCKENVVKSKPDGDVAVSGVGDKGVCLNFTVNITK